MPEELPLVIKWKMYIKGHREIKQKTIKDGLKFFMAPLNVIFHYVIDGGSLLQRISWTIGNTYEGSYISYLQNNYGSVETSHCFL